MLSSIPGWLLGTGAAARTTTRAEARRRWSRLRGTKHQRVQPVTWSAIGHRSTHKPKKRGFTTKRAAEAFANTVEVEKLTGNYVAPSLGQVTEGELGKEWLARQAHHKASWSARLESVWRVHVEPKWGRVAVASLTFVKPRSKSGWPS